MSRNSGSLVRIGTLPKLSALMGAAALLIAGTSHITHAGPSQAASNDHAHTNEHAHADAHAHHHHAPTPGYARKVEAYRLPQVDLIREDGSMARFPAMIDDGKPVILNFIYTSCTAICPVLSQTFADVQDLLGSDAMKAHMVSISIDPEHDTPARLAEYARRFGAGPQWTHLTGSLQASLAVQKAFGAFFVDKMNHRPLAFMRRSPGESWVRLEGFAAPEDLVREYRNLLKAGS